MSRIYIRKYKKNPDFWEVCGGGFKIVRRQSKTDANEIATARRRVRAKRAKRAKK